jgi:hypothetical protein
VVNPAAAAVVPDLLQSRFCSLVDVEIGGSQVMHAESTRAEQLQQGCCLHFLHWRE